MKTKDVYQADENGFFMYQVLAYELSLAPGTYNIPYGAHEDAPPAAGAGMVARRVGNEWRVVEDNRGDVLYVVASGAQYAIGTKISIDDVGHVYDGGGPIPDWLTNVVPEPTPAEDPQSV